MNFLNRWRQAKPAAIRSEQPSGLMQMHGEVDEYGECPNCVNPPHDGPCRRKQPPSDALMIEQARAFLSDHYKTHSAADILVYIDNKARQESALEELTYLSKLHGACRVEVMDRYIASRLKELRK